MNSAVQRDYNRETEVVKSRIVNYWSARSDSFMAQREEELQSGSARSGRGSFCPTCRERQGSESWMWGADAAFSPCFWQRADIM